MNKVHIKFHLRNDRANKFGLYPIYLYANVNGKVKHFTLNHSIPAKAWNDRKQEVSITHHKWKCINDDISRYRSSAERLRIAADESNEMISQYQFEMFFRGGIRNSADIFNFIEEDIKQFGNAYAPETIKMYKSQARKLKTFRSELTFSEITPLFWKHYNSFLISLNNNESTRWKAFSTIKTFINRAIENGVIKTDPLKGVKVKKPQGNRQSLTQVELKLLEKIYAGTMNNRFKTVLVYFLFAVYTGLRYSDVKSLRHKNIFYIGENPYLEFVQQKTSTPLIIPLGKKAMEYLPEKGLPNDPLFHMYCNQITNRLLKEIMKIAEINKSISFHCARHTLGSIALELTGDIAAVSRMLGHKKLSTTQIYAKVSDNSLLNLTRLMDEM